MTIYDTTLAAVLARLQGSPDLIANANVRRAHPTDVTRDASPAVRVIDGPDKAMEGRNDCFAQHDAEFTVRIILRGDAESVSAEAWNIAQDVLSRLSPLASSYSDGAQLQQPTITPDREVADQDLYALDMLFRLKYVSAAWSLNAA
jgi:hypothetical protein